MKVYGIINKNGDSRILLREFIVNVSPEGKALWNVINFQLTPDVVAIEIEYDPQEALVKRCSIITGD